MLRQDPARVLRDFRDSLQVRGMLQQEERRLIKNCGDMTLLNYEKGRRNRWQMFLDDLCLLCDNDRGGCTTTSIATEQRLCKVIFWLAMNAGDLGRAKRWLEDILNVAQRGVGARVDVTSSLVHDLFVRSVRRSPQRVANYANRLSSVLEDMEGKSGLTPEWSQIKAVSRRILRLCGDHVAMCEGAYAYSKAAAAEQCEVLSDTPQKYDEVYRARHYIGRLSSWRKAARNVVSLGACFPVVLANYEVATISHAETISSSLWTAEHDFDALLARVMPNYRGHSMTCRLEGKLKDASRSMGVLQDRQFRAKPHAEAVVLDHFFSGNFAFVMGDKYVACSKPSCYCCKLYFKFHPLRAVTGRNHGNLWIQWGPPRSLCLTNGRVDRITLKILRRMSDEVRKDVLSAVLPGTSRHFDMFDSTTGFSASRANFAMV